MSKLEDSKELIRELAQLLEDSSLSEIEVSDESVRIRVARELTQVPIQAQAHAPAPPPLASPDPTSGKSTGETAPPDRQEDHPGAVLSPMVGTAYLASEPGAPPFVKEGATVNEGDTVMIVEAMKVMNPIPAPKSGTVLRILVRDAQPVEYGEPLLIIE